MTADQNIDHALERAARAGKFNLFRTVATAITLLLVTTLFFVWVVFGQQTMQRQNSQILSAVNAQLVDVQTGINDAIERNTVGDRVIVCLLNVDPELRSEKVTQLCVNRARQGYDTLSDQQVKDLAKA